MNFQEQSNLSYEQIHTYKNLELAFTRAKKRKSKKPHIQEYKQNLKENNS